MSRELLARAWAAGAGPGDGPLTIDLDSTLCETYGPPTNQRCHAAIGAPGGAYVVRSPASDIGTSL